MWRAPFTAFRSITLCELCNSTSSYRRSVIHRSRVRIMATAAPKAPEQRTKPTQGQLVAQALYKTSSALRLVDIGANLMDDAFNKDRDEVLERAGIAGVDTLIITGSSVSSSRRAAQFISLRPQGGLYFTAGVHPHSAKDCDAQTIEQLRSLAQHTGCVAIGECGLDFNRNFSPPDVQERWFDEQIQLAVELRKPLFMHCRDAGEKLAEIISKHEITAPGIVHCFTSTAEDLDRFLGLGLYIGITGWCCDDRPERGGSELAALLPRIPLDRLLLETDAPYLTPRTIKPSKSRPHRNEPALLPYVLEVVAASRGSTMEEVAAATTENARRVFGLPS